MDIPEPQEQYCVGSFLTMGSYSTGKTACLNFLCILPTVLTWLSQHSKHTYTAKKTFSTLSFHHDTDSPPHPRKSAYFGCLWVHTTQKATDSPHIKVVVLVWSYPEQCTRWINILKAKEINIVIFPEFSLLKQRSILYLPLFLWSANYKE